MGCRIVFAWRDISSIWRYRDFFTSEILLRRIVSNNRRSSVSLPVRERYFETASSRFFFLRVGWKIIRTPEFLLRDLTNRKNGS